MIRNSYNSIMKHKWDQRESYIRSDRITVNGRTLERDWEEDEAISYADKAKLVGCLLSDQG